MKKLTAGKTCSQQFRMMDLGEEMEIMFSEKLPNRVSAICSNLKTKEEKEYKCFIEEELQRTVVKRVK